MKVFVILLCVILVLAILLAAAVVAVLYKPFMLKQRLKELKNNNDIGFFDQYHKEARASLKEDLQKVLNVTLEKDILCAFELYLDAPSQYEGQVSCKAFILICSSKEDAALIADNVKKLEKEYDEFAVSADRHIVFYGEKYLLQFFGQA